MAQQTIEWEPEALAMLEQVPPAWDHPQRLWRRERIAERARQQGHTKVRAAMVEEVLKEVSRWGWGGALFQYDRSNVPWWSPFGEEFDPDTILEEELHGRGPAATEHAVDFYVEVLGLQPGARVLDLGCGYGRVAVPLARRGFVVTGIDQWSPGLAVARARARENSVEVTFVEADYCRPPYDGLGDEAVFDAIFSLGSLFVQSPGSDQEARSLMVELNRLLKPDGYFFVNDIPNPSSPVWSQQPDDIQLVQELGGGSFVLQEHRRRGEDGFHRLIRIEPGQAPREFRATSRRFTPPQVIALLNDAGLTVRRRWSHNWDNTVSELSFAEYKETDDLPQSDGLAFLVQKEA